MSALSIQPTYPIFTDIDGQPLEAGYVWIGVANLQPIGNPINVYWDAALTIQATQPIRTLAGYPSRNGAPARLYVNSDYSIQVQNRNGSVVYSAPAATERYSNSVISTINASQVVYDPAGTGAVATTVQTKLRETVSVLDFGADKTGATNSTAAFQAAIDSLGVGGGTIYAPKGTYLLNTVVFPTEPTVINFYGDGIGATILQMASPTNPIFRSKGVADGTPFIRSNGNIISSFSVKAHASGSYSNLNHIAIDTQGFAAVRFEKIGFLSNAGGSCGVMFYSSAETQLTYEQTFDGININGQVGPGYVLKTFATNFLKNTNLICFKNSWINSNSNMVACLDMSCCTQYTINDNLLETSGNYGIILGNIGHIFSNWIELAAIAPIQFQNTASVTSSTNTLQANYFSGFSGAIPIPADCAGNVFINNGAGVLTFVPASGAVSPVIVGGAGNPAVPTIIKSSGPAGTLTLVAASQYSNLDGTYLLLYTFLPSSAPSNFTFTIVNASGYTPRKLNAAAYDGANSVPYTVSNNYPLTNFTVAIPNTNLVTLCVQVTLQ